MDGDRPDEPTWTSTSTPAPDAPPRRLYREPEEKKLTGLCGGIADHVGADPTAVRLAAVLLVLVSPITIAVYLIAAVVVPKRPATVPRQPAPQWRAAGTLTPHMIGLLALALFVGLTGDHWWWFEVPVMGLALLGVGVWLLAGDRQPPPGGPEGPGGGGSEDRGGGRDREIQIPHQNLATASDQSTTLLGEVEPERALVGPPASEAASGTTLDKTEDETHPVPVPPESASSVPDDSAHSAGPQGEVPPPVPPWGLGTPSAPLTSPAPAPASVSVSETAPEDRGPFATFLGVLLVAAGVVSLMAVLGVFDLDAGIALAALLVAVGLGLVVGAWWGRARSLIGVGIPVVALLLVGDAADLPVGAGSGERTIVIDEADELNENYELFAGELELDLRDMPVRRGEVPRLRAEVGMGNLQVRLPERVTAEVDTLVGIGDVQGMGPNGSTEGGVRDSENFVVEGREGGGRVQLDLQVGLGEIEVRRG